MRLDRRRGDLRLPMMVHYYRTTRDGRIAFGQGGHRHAFGGRVEDEFFAQSNGAASVLRRDLDRLVPFAEGVEVTHAWGGPADRTTDGAPILGRLPGGVPIVYGIGYSGNGVAPSLTGREDPRLERARARRRRIVGERAEPRGRRQVPSGAGALPGRVRRPGRGEAQRASRGRRARRRPAATRRVAALAPQGFFRVKR